MTATAAATLDPITVQKIASLEKLARLWLARITAKAQTCKLSDAELLRISLGSRPDLGQEGVDIAYALWMVRTGQGDAIPPADLERAVNALDWIEQPAPAAPDAVPA